MPQSATPLSRAMPSGVFTLAEQPSVTVIIDDHRRFHELQEPRPEGRGPGCSVHMRSRTALGGEVCVDSMKFPPRCQRNPKPGKVGRRNPASTSGNHATFESAWEDLGTR
jgi:hypothetical protein